MLADYNRRETCGVILRLQALPEARRHELPGVGAADRWVQSRIGSGSATSLVE
jgi:hypothetical protein